MSMRQFDGCSLLQNAFYCLVQAAHWSTHHFVLHFYRLVGKHGYSGSHHVTVILDFFSGLFLVTRPWRLQSADVSQSDTGPLLRSYNQISQQISATVVVMERPNQYGIYNFRKNRNDIKCSDSSSSPFWFISNTTVQTDHKISHHTKLILRSTNPSDSHTVRARI